MSQAITLSSPSAKSIASQTPLRPISKMRNRQVEDLQLKCEVAAKIKKGSRLECAKAVGFFGLAVATMAALTLLALKIGEIASVVLVSLLSALIPATLAVSLVVVVSAAAIVWLLFEAAENIVKPIFNKGVEHLDRSAELKVEAEFV